MDTRRGFVKGALAGAAGGVAAAAAMYLLAAFAGTRTLPALLSEPLLGMLPGPVFGFLIDRLQHLGKVFLELGLLLAMVVLLAALGAATGAFAARRRVAHLSIAAGAAAWVVVVLAVLPLGGAGLLGLGDGIATPVAWAVVFAVYAFVLETGVGQPAPTVMSAQRRRFLGTGAVALLSVAVLGFRLVPEWLRELAQPVAAGGELPKEITPAGSFYVVSKNFDDPVVDASRWALAVRGLVAAPLRLSYEDFRALPSVAVLTTLECISNNVGGNQISTGEFAGIRLGDLLERARPAAQARFVNFRSRDGYSESLPLELALSDPDILVAHSLGGAPLPAEHGFPARVLVPGRYGMKGPKWLEEIELAANESGGYWEAQGWDRAAVVRTTSRIDTPLEGAILPGGTVTVGGIAFAGTRGISKVEVSTDGGRTWSEAERRPPRSPLTWTIWTFDWPAPAGEHTLVVRATDGQYALQSSAVAPSFPAGSSGYHRVRVSVSG